MTAQQEIEWSQAGQMLYAEAGITTAHGGATHLPQFERCGARARPNRTSSM